MFAAHWSGSEIVSDVVAVPVAPKMSVTVSATGNTPMPSVAICAAVTVGVAPLNVSIPAPLPTLHA